MEPETAVKDFKIDCEAAEREALNRLQHKLAMREMEQKVELELENERTQYQLNAVEAFLREETKASRSLSMKLIVISGHKLGMVPQGSKSVISMAGYHVIRNLNEPSEFTMMQLDF